MHNSISTLTSLFNLFNCKFLVLLSLHANENFHIHEHICDVTVGIRCYIMVDLCIKVD